MLLHLDRGHYFTLNATAAWVWEQLEHPQELDQLHSNMIQTFQIDGATARIDLEGLVAELLAESLVESDPF